MARSVLSRETMLLPRNSWLVYMALLMVWPCSALDLNQAPAGPGDWGYRPGDGETTPVNPPGFSWRPTDGIRIYTVQIATDEAFAHVVREQTGIPWSAYRTDALLKPGPYYWRYRGVADSGSETAWSTVRSFSVPVDAVAFPQPALPELLKRMPDGHPRLFFRPEDIGHLQALADGPLNDRWQSLVDQADKLLENPPDTSEPPKYPKDIEPRGAEWKKIWWGNRRRAIAVADSAATLGFVYRLSG